MKLTKFLIIASVLTARTCRTEIVLTPSSDETTSNLVKDLVKIVKPCYADRLDAVGLAGNLPDVLSRTLSTEHSIPVVLIDNARNNMSNESRRSVPGNVRRKIHVFIIEVSNPQQLDIIIEMNIRLSNFWNHMASFIIVDRSSGCTNPVSYLLVAWKRNAINAKVLCYENESRKTIYNYNPFTDQAPVPWQRYVVTRGIIDHPFTVFYQNYRADKSVCVNLDFDKTKDLCGYEIRVDSTNFKPNFDYIHKHKKNSRQMQLFTFTMLRTHDLIFRTLNGTRKHWNRRRNYLPSMPFFDRPGDNDITNGMVLITSTPKVLSTHPHTTVGFTLVSRFRRHKSRHNEIFYVIDIYSWIGIVIVYLITFTFFKTFVKQSITTAVLNIVCFTCSMSIRNLTDKTSLRIYLSSLLLFAITMQGILQCDLATQLTASVPLKNIDTLEDIETFGYKHCVLKGIVFDFRTPYLERNLVVDTSEGCFRRVINDTFVYTTLTAANIFDRAKEENLHVSKEYISSIYVAFQIRDDWALEEPVNRIILKLIESDTLEPWDLRCSAVGLSYFQKDKTVQNSSDYKQIVLGDLTFAFTFLGTGLACATDKPYIK